MKFSLPCSSQTALYAVLVCILVGCGAPHLAQENVHTTPGTAPGASPTILMRYENATFEQIISDISKAFGLPVEKHAALNMRATIIAAKPLTENESIALLNEALLVQGYMALKINQEEAQLTLRVTQVPWPKGIPVHTGSDASEIRVSDDLVMQIIPISYTSAGVMKNHIPPLLSSDAEVLVTENLIIITDTSSHVHDAVVALDLLEGQNKPGDVPSSEPATSPAH